MGKIALKNQPCGTGSCKSSDARQIYEDGSSFCFSCKTWRPVGYHNIKSASDPEQFDVVEGAPHNTKSILELPIRGLPDRNISESVCKFFGVRVGYNSEGEVDAHYYPYENDTKFKIRMLPKAFGWQGHSHKLFGIDKFNAGGKRLVITEGEIDALSVAQASLDRYKKIYPVVALSSAGGTKAVLEAREWIRSFDEVVLCVDPDEAGQRAKEEMIRYIGADKVKIVRLDVKDPNECLKKYGSEKLMVAIFEAGAYIPTGIISKEEIWEALSEANDKPAVPYPPCLEGLNTKIKGQRLNEIVLFISGTGCGKSTVLREIMLNDLAVTDAKIGIAALEETPRETALNLSGMHLERNPASQEISLADLKVGFDGVFGDDRIILMNHEGSFSDGTVLDNIEYMCLSGCRYIFIDHITILVAEGVENLTGNEAQDKMMADLGRLVKKYPVWIGLVSHLRKAASGGKSFEEGRMPSVDDIKGSGSIKQISYDIVAFARNTVAALEEERTRVKLCVLKARTTSLTGPVQGYRYVFPTGRLKAVDEDHFEDLM